MILEKVAAERPALALELYWQFMGLAGNVFERVDDSNGRVSEVFRTACADLGTVAGKGSLDCLGLADQVWDALTNNLYGEYDRLVEAIFPALGASGSGHLKKRLTAALPHPTGQGCTRHWVSRCRDLRSAQRQFYSPLPERKKEYSS
jgi:hypothetical protein